MEVFHLLSKLIKTKKTEWYMKSEVKIMLLVFFNAKGIGHKTLWWLFILYNCHLCNYWGLPEKSRNPFKLPAEIWCILWTLAADAKGNESEAMEASLCAISDIWWLWYQNSLYWVPTNKDWRGTLLFCETFYGQAMQHFVLVALSNATTVITGYPNTKPTL